MLVCVILCILIKMSFIFKNQEDSNSNILQGESFNLVKITPWARLGISFPSELHNRFKIGIRKMGFIYFHKSLLYNPITQSRNVNLKILFSHSFPLSTQSNYSYNWDVLGERHSQKNWRISAEWSVENGVPWGIS